MNPYDIKIALAECVGVVRKEYIFYPETQEYETQEWIADYKGGGIVPKKDIPEHILKVFNHYNKEQQ